MKRGRGGWRVSGRHSGGGREERVLGLTSLIDILYISILRTRRRQDGKNLGFVGVIFS